MKLYKIEEVNEFMNAVDSCRGDVYLVSAYGDKYNIKSKLTQYLALGMLLNKEYDDLELFCDYKDDEAVFIEFFKKHPNTI